MEIIGGSVTLRTVCEIIAMAFIVGGVWRDVRSTMRSVASLKSTYAKDRQIIVRLVEQHNMNHDAQIHVPEINGNGG